MRSSRFALALLLAGCSSVLGLDEFEAGAGGAAPASTGASTSTGDASTSTAATAGTGSSGGDGGGGASSQGGGGSAADGGGGAGGGDVVGPAVVISSASVAHNGTTNSSRAVFLFTSDPLGAPDFECSLDGGAFEDCTSGFDRSLLPGGTRTLHVRARDGMGTLGPILERRWTIEAVGTTIVALRQHTIPDDTLVQIGGNARVTIDVVAQGQRNVFVQDVNGSAGLNALRNHGIRTVPRGTPPTMEPGRAVVIVGTFQSVGGTDVIAAAEFTPGGLLTPYEAYYTDDTEEVDAEDLESVLFSVGGEIPGNFNCQGGCTLPSPQKCLEGCGPCHPLEYLDLTSTGTFDWGTYRGVLVGSNNRFLWFVESEEGGDDICL